MQTLTRARCEAKMYSLRFISKERARGGTRGGPPTFSSSVRRPLGPGRRGSPRRRRGREKQPGCGVEAEALAEVAEPALQVGVAARAEAARAVHAAAALAELAPLAAALLAGALRGKGEPPLVAVASGRNNAYMCFIWQFCHCYVAVKEEDGRLSRDREAELTLAQTTLRHQSSTVPCLQVDASTWFLVAPHDGAASALLKGKQSSHLVINSYLIYSLFCLE